MKRNKQRRIATAVALFGTLATGALISGCGSKSSSPVASVPGPVAPGVPGVGAGCIPINQPIPFTGTNNYFSWVNIVGGQIPPNVQSQFRGQAQGAMIVGGNAAGGPYGRQGPDGSISLNVTPAGTQLGGIYPAPGQQYPGYGVPQGYPSQYPTNPTAPAGYYPPTGYNPYFGQAPGQANVTGVIQISPAVQNQIYATMSQRLGINAGMPYPGTGYPSNYGGYYFPGQPGTYPGQTPGYPQQPYMPSTAQQICVSGISMDLGHYYNIVYNGSVYLYLNGTQMGYVLYW